MCSKIYCGMRYYVVYYEITPHLFPNELAKKLGIVNTDIKWTFYYAHEDKQDENSVRPALETHLQKFTYNDLVISKIEEISEQQFLDATSDDE